MVSNEICHIFHTSANQPFAHSTNIYGQSERKARRTLGRVSKSFGWAKTLVGIGASHNITDYNMLVSGIVNDARMNTTAVSFNYSLRPARFLSVEGKSNVNIYKQKNLTAPELSSDPTTVWEHFLKLYVFPAKGWMLSVKNELFHTNDKSIGINHFLDLAIGYKAKRW